MTEARPCIWHRFQGGPRVRLGVAAVEHRFGSFFKGDPSTDDIDVRPECAGRVQGQRKRPITYMLVPIEVALW